MSASYADLQAAVNGCDPEVLFGCGCGFKTLGRDRARRQAPGNGRTNPASLERQVMEQLKRKAGVAPAVATFEGGGDMLINVLNHTLDMGIGELQEMRAQLDAGTIRLLAVVGDERLPQFPDVPTAREQGIALSVRKFRGLAGPKGTPPDVVAAWESAVRTLLEDPEYKRLYLSDSLQPGFIPHAEYVDFIVALAGDGAFLKSRRDQVTIARASVRSSQNCVRLWNAGAGRRLRCWRRGSPQVILPTLLVPRGCRTPMRPSSRGCR